MPPFPRVDASGVRLGTGTQFFRPSSADGREIARGVRDLASGLSSVADAEFNAETKVQDAIRRRDQRAAVLDAEASFADAQAAHIQGSHRRPYESGRHQRTRLSEELCRDASQAKRRSPGWRH